MVDRPVNDPEPKPVGWRGRDDSDDAQTKIGLAIAGTFVSLVGLIVG